MKFEENDTESIKGLTYTSFLKKFLKSLYSQAPNRVKMEEIREIGKNPEIGLF